MVISLLASSCISQELMDNKLCHSWNLIVLESVVKYWSNHETWKRVLLFVINIVGFSTLFDGAPYVLDDKNTVKLFYVFFFFFFFLRSVTYHQCSECSFYRKCCPVIRKFWMEPVWSMKFFREVWQNLFELRWTKTNKNKKNKQKTFDEILITEEDIT